MAQRPASAASRVMSSTLNRTERKSKERSPTSFKGTTAASAAAVNNSCGGGGSSNNNINAELSTLASVVAVTSAAASIKRDEERNRRLSTDAAVRVEVSDSSVVYVSNDNASERKTSPAHSTTYVAIAEPTTSHRGTTTVRVGGDVSEKTNHATMIEVVGMSDASMSKDVTSTSDKVSIS